MTLEDKELVERLMDKYSVARIIDVMSGICGEKAVHIAENWQDVSLAKQWTCAAAKLEIMRADMLKFHMGDSGE